MRRGFTLIEMMIALSISTIILTPIVGLLSSVWLISKEASDEVQCALHARNIREQLFYSLPGRAYGLTSVQMIKFEDGEFRAYYRKNDEMPCWVANYTSSDDVWRYAFDTGKTSGFRDEDSPLQFIFLKVCPQTKKSGDPGYVAYYDRLVVPVFGKHPEKQDLEDCFGM